MFSHEPSPIRNQFSTPNHFLDDSILFGQQSNYGTNYENPYLRTPFTANNRTEEDVNGDFSTLLNSDGNYPIQPSTEVEPTKDKLKSMVQYVNYALQNYGFSSLGDLLSIKEEDIQKTVNTILEMIQQRQKDIEYRKEVVEKMAKLQSDTKMFMDVIEREKTQNKQLAKEVGSLKNMLAMAEKKSKADREKLVAEKEELMKQMSKFSQKNVQYQHEIRKKEVEVNKMKEQVRKTILDKTTLGKGPSAEMCSFDSQTQFYPKNSNNCENDFPIMIKNNIDQYRTKLLNENQDLRACLKVLFEDLNTVVAQKKDEIIKNKMAENSEYEDNAALRQFYEKHFADSELTYLRSGASNLPFDKAAADIHTIFKDNMQALENFFDKVTTANFSDSFLRDIANEFSDIDQEFAGIRNLIDLKKAVQGFKCKLNRRRDGSFGVNKENHISNVNQLKCIAVPSFRKKEFKDGEQESPDTVFMTPYSQFEYDDVPSPVSKHTSSNIAHPIISKQTSSDTAYPISKQGSFESPPVNEPQVKRVKAEVNKWKLALHTKSQPMFIPPKTPISVSEDDGTDTDRNDM